MYRYACLVSKENLACEGSVARLEHPKTKWACNHMGGLDKSTTGGWERRRRSFIKWLKFADARLWGIGKRERV